MSQSRIFLLIPAALIVAACASTGPDQYASRECKVVPGKFVNVPKKDPTPAERAEALLKMQRFAYSRGGYGTGTNMPADAVRDCYY
jgi:hypothetical protein